MLQLVSAEADDMAPMSFDELLASWGRGAIRRRFHELSMQAHPDKCSLPQADQVRHLNSRDAYICDSCMQIFFPPPAILV